MFSVNRLWKLQTIWLGQEIVYRTTLDYLIGSSYIRRTFRLLVVRLGSPPATVLHHRLIVAYVAVHNRRHRLVILCVNFCIREDVFIYSLIYDAHDIILTQTVHKAFTFEVAFWFKVIKQKSYIHLFYQNSKLVPK